MIRRGIVVVHGVGHQSRVDQLDWVVESLAAFLGRALGHDNVQLTARTSPGGDELASARIRLTLPDKTEPFEEWHIREAWWAQSFRPSNSVTVLGWAVVAGWYHVLATARDVVGRSAGRLAGHRIQHEESGVWTRDEAGKIHALFDIVVWLVITLGYVLVYAIAAVLILPLYVFLVLPLAVLWPAGIGRLQVALVNTLTGGIGDQHATTNRRVAAAGAADTVVRALWSFIAPERPGNTRYDTVTVIAHSGGCVVSFDALVRHDVRRWLSESDSLRRITWITVGSGLNLAWRMRAKKAWDCAFWSRSLGDHVNWIDIYSRYDPVPQGAPPAEMVEALAGPPPVPFVTVQVTNRDWPLSDHGAYWENFEEAMSRMVHAITDSRLGWQPLTALGGSYAVQTPAAGATDAHPLAAPVEQAIMAAPDRQRQVTTRRFASFLLIAAGVLFLITASPSIGHWLLGEQVTGPVLSWSGVDLSWPKVEWREALDARIPSSFAGIDFTDKRPWIVGAIALAFLAEVLVILARLGMHLWSWRHAEPTSQWIGSYGSH
jgi:hypothetical protein